MSAEDESTQELLWDDELAAQFLESVSSQPSTSSSSSPPQTVAATGAKSTTPPRDLKCYEDPLALEDWIPNEEEEFPNSQPIPESARALMEARMEAPQGGLDSSYASHSCEHPTRPKKRARKLTYTWVERPSEQRFVGTISY